MKGTFSSVSLVRDRDAVLVAEVEVEQREIRLLAIDRRQRLADGRRGPDMARAEFEQDHLGGHRDDQIVFHDQRRP